MPLPQNTDLVNVAENLLDRVQAYNDGTNGRVYNTDYNTYINARRNGIADSGSLSQWITGDDAADSIRTLLNSFGMNARNSNLVSIERFRDVLNGLNEDTIGWLATKSLPLPDLSDINPNTGRSLSQELTLLYNTLSRPGNVSDSGGFVVASKTAHCLFPELAPMIDGAHTGLSYYHISRRTYLPPPNVENWNAWVGHEFAGTVNPSPRGAGRNSWNADQFLATIGVNQHIYVIWQNADANRGLNTFLNLDGADGTTSIPRVIDKVLW